MSNRKVSAALAMCTVLAGASWSAASDLVSSSQNSLALTPTVYADDAAAAPAPTPAKPLMALLDKTPIGKPLDDWGITISGFIEGGYTYNFDVPHDHTNVGRVFDFEDEDPTLNQLDLAVDRAVDASKGKFDVGFHVEWIYGGDSRLIHSNGLMDNGGPGDGPDEQFDLNQAYLTLAIPLGKGVTVTVGKFVTLLGYEYINPTLNPLYSHSYLFGFAIPFTHTGVLAKYNFTDKLAVTAGITRGWEQSLKDNNDAIDATAQIAYTVSDKCTASLTAISGPEETGDNSHYRTVVDGIVTYKFGDNLSVALNGDYGWEAADAATGGHVAQWFGGAGYVAYTLDSHFTINGRVEYFNDDNGARGLGTEVYEATLGLAIKPLPNDQYGSGLIFRPELRWDYANDAIFDDANAHDQFTFGADVIYAF
jgi:hypothetical protein